MYVIKQSMLSFFAKKNYILEISYVTCFTKGKFSLRYTFADLKGEGNIDYCNLKSVISKTSTLDIKM